MSTTTNLELLFKDESGKNTKIVVPEPRSNLDRQTTEKTMQTIVDSDLFTKDGKDLHASNAGARYVKKEVTDIFVVE